MVHNIDLNCLELNTPHFPRDSWKISLLMTKADYRMRRYTAVDTHSSLRLGDTFVPSVPLGDWGLAVISIAISPLV